ncbi:hypothetical protein K458DRAFT_384763 [Lentithecium fluviatile CBS 122367]|uniref:Uncharacterized protein n=1 Tax=Lentithecium fluviatile CBS 122367 TaxID=1168545 RepID=A0A6G1JEC0_9PLEO|nr:hypothetical protein K458DRAFT_384763 [Lentithecium fluviatile CBS 122367]
MTPQICKSTNFAPQRLVNFSLTLYPQEFHAAMAAAVQRIDQGADVFVCFRDLDGWLFSEDGGAHKCRYHQHGRGDLCFNPITDETDVEVAELATRRPGFD